MKGFLWGLFIVIILAALGFGGWYFFLKKGPEGSICVTSSKCEDGLKCLNKTCSSGETGSSCEQKTDCLGQFCVKNICTEGKITNACIGSKDCETSLLCPKSICVAKPDASLYFGKMATSKMRPGSPPGPDNPLTATTTFRTTDGIEIDFTGVKAATIGTFYYEFVNTTTGATRSSKNEQTLSFEGRDRGTGTDLANLAPGEYDLNIYFKDALVHSTVITVTK